MYPSLTHVFSLFIIFRSSLSLNYLSRYFFTKNICNYNNHSIKSNVGNPPMSRLLYFPSILGRMLSFQFNILKITSTFIDYLIIMLLWTYRFKNCHRVSHQATEIEPFTLLVSSVTPASLTESPGVPKAVLRALGQTTLSMISFKWLESVRMLNSVSCRVLYESRWVLTLIFYYMWQDNWPNSVWWVTCCVALHSCSKLSCSFRKCLRHSLESDLFAHFWGRDPVFLYLRSDIA